MPSRDEYREKAKACVAQAELIDDPYGRVAMLAIARAYLRLAERIVAPHRNDLGDPSPAER